MRDAGRIPPGGEQRAKAAEKRSRTLVTGATGFVGRHIQRLWPDLVAWPNTDLTKPEQVHSTVRELLETTPFDKVLHLAGLSSPRDSIADPALAFDTNLMGTVHLFQGLDQCDWRGRFLLVSSCAVYGNQGGELTEGTPPKPANPYAVSKVAAEFATLEWGARSGNVAMVARPFNHSGPGQIDHYFLASMAAQIVGLPPEGGELEVGNLDVHRDFLHVEDVIEAYRLLLLKGKTNQIYHISNGHSRPLREFVEGLARFSGRQVSLKVTPERYREDVTEPLRISVERLGNDTGWKPRKTLEDLAADLIGYWQSKAVTHQ